MQPNRNINFTDQTKCRYFERNGIYYREKHDIFVKIEQIL